MSEQIVTGKKYRILTDVAQKVWQRVSFWTKSSDVEFDDGKTAQNKVGAINGITDSLVSNSSNIAASAKAVSELNGNINVYVDEEGKLHFVNGNGADSVLNFNSTPSYISNMRLCYSNHTITAISGRELSVEQSFIAIPKEGLKKISFMFTGLCDAIENSDNYANRYYYSRGFIASTASFYYPYCHRQPGNDNGTSKVIDIMFKNDTLYEYNDFSDQPYDYIVFGVADSQLREGGPTLYNISIEY